eukprot:265996_1
MAPACIIYWYLCTMTAITVADEAVDVKPNILFIMADDLGWANVGYHNTENDEVSTPNIDYLVHNGLQLNRHYVASSCSPTRSSFQSGRLSVHVNTNNGDGINYPTMGVHPDMQCIAEKLKIASYSTHQIGKWDAGFATFRHIPIARGYDTSFGYLGKSINYFTKKVERTCDQWNLYLDLWENDAPVSDQDDLSSDVYVEELLVTRVLDKLDEMAHNSEDEPFFIFYASHLPHYPSQLPSDCVEKGFYTEFDDDEGQCEQNVITNPDNQIYPDWEDDISGYYCRSLLQAQVSVLDDIIGQITDKLKENDFWENTLIVFTTDNGGSLELQKTGGNNYPLRGGKASSWEGGIRGTAFVSGGYLPKSRRGQVENGMMHISDWYVTFSAMVGVEPHDYDAVSKELPDVDGYNMWPLIAGEVTESPRNELVMDQSTLLSGEYKLIMSANKYSVWQGSAFPNSSTTMTGEALEETSLTECVAQSDWGCLFNVVKDPTEHDNIADEYPEITERLIARLKELQEDFYESDYDGADSCPDGYSYDTGSLQDGEDTCGCWMSQHNYNNCYGPYQDLDETQIHFMEENSAAITLNAKQYLFNKTDDIYYGIVALCVVILVWYTCVCGCKWNNNARLLGKNQSSLSVPNYGSNKYNNEK